MTLSTMYEDKLLKCWILLFLMPLNSIFHNATLMLYEMDGRDGNNPHVNNL